MATSVELAVNSTTAAKMGSFTGVGVSVGIVPMRLSRSNWNSSGACHNLRSAVVGSRGGASFSRDAWIQTGESSVNTAVLVTA